MFYTSYTSYALDNDSPDPIKFINDYWAGLFVSPLGNSR
jgi:hypothetical protein